MSNKNKIQTAIDLIDKAQVKNEKVHPDEIYSEMKEAELYEIAETIAELINLVYDVREVLEGEI